VVFWKKPNPNLNSAVTLVIHSVSLSIIIFLEEGLNCIVENMAREDILYPQTFSQDK